MAQERQSVKTEDAQKLAEQDAARQQDTERGRREAKIAERQEHIDDIDDFLDDIDALLEETTIMTNYVQKGGE